MDFGLTQSQGLAQISETASECGSISNTFKSSGMVLKSGITSKNLYETSSDSGFKLSKLRDFQKNAPTLTSYSTNLKSSGLQVSKPEQIPESTSQESYLTQHKSPHRFVPPTPNPQSATNAQKIRASYDSLSAGQGGYLIQQSQIKSRVPISYKAIMKTGTYQKARK